MRRYVNGGGMRFHNRGGRKLGIELSYSLVACNCHGHAEDCFYDEAVALRKDSLNMLGEYLGGGVCVGCRDNTEGINCQT